MKQNVAPVDPFSEYSCIRIVNTFAELISTSFDETVNAICWKRTLVGDFDEIADRLSETDGIATIEESDLRKLALSPEGQRARDILIQDQHLLREQGLDPILDCISAYPRDTEPSPVATDVYSFHVDTATSQTDTYLCSYNLASSEGLSNSEAIRRVDVPETRTDLLKLFGDEENDEFLNFLSENHFDLHYFPTPNATPYSFGLGNLWRIATDYPDSPALPCIHRAPTTSPGQPPRLLLIS